MSGFGNIDARLAKGLPMANPLPSVVGTAVVGMVTTGQLAAQAVRTTGQAWRAGCLQNAAPACPHRDCPRGQCILAVRRIEARLPDTP